MIMNRIPLIDKIFCRFFDCLFKKNILLLKDKFFNKSRITIYDRSFMDSLIHKKKFTYYNRFYKFLYNKDNTFLLKVNAQMIIKRKDELTEKEIFNYYEQFENYDIKSSLYVIESNIKYLIFTPEYLKS